MEFLLGALGCIAVLLLVFAGLLIGWWANSWTRERTAVRTAEELSEEERKKLIQSQEAFHLLQNYTPEHAYGNYTSPDREERGEG